MPNKLLIGAFALLILGGSFFIGYRYTESIKDSNTLERQKIQLEFAKLQQEKDLEVKKADQERIKEETKLESQRQEAEAIVQANLAKAEKYDTCIAQADKQYEVGWKNTCNLLSIRNKAEYADCYERCSNPTKTYSCADGGDPAKFCRDDYPLIDAVNCRELPSRNADPIIKEREKAKETCLQLFKQ